MKLFYRAMTKEDLTKWESLARSEFLAEDFCSAEYLLKDWETARGWILLTDENELIGCTFNSRKDHAFNPGGSIFWKPLSSLNSVEAATADTLSN
jgi:hypothetical protein